MKAATWPQPHPEQGRLLYIDAPGGTYADRQVGDLGTLLAPGDLLVVNDAATLPASLRGRGPAGEPLELRLCGPGETGGSDADFPAVLLGAGGWETPTERRPPPPLLLPGDRIRVPGDAPGADPGDLEVEVRALSPLSPRLLQVRFHGARGPIGDAALWAALYRHGRPVQYAHLRAPLSLWHVQTAYAGRPWAAEAPSAGLSLRWELLLPLRRRGVALATLTHAAGLSATGDPAIDAALPFPERYEIPAETVAAIASARARGGRVIAVGTTVVRALEGCAAAHGGDLVAGPGVTGLRLGPASRRRVVDGLLTGMHDPTASHYQLLQSFAALPLLTRAYAHAAQVGYLGHEFGDANLIVAARG